MVDAAGVTWARVGRVRQGQAEVGAAGGTWVRVGRIRQGQAVVGAAGSPGQEKAGLCRGKMW